jgi:hypothetical protein
MNQLFSRSFLVVPILTFYFFSLSESAFAITNGGDDITSLEANIVVKISGATGGLCTGTLISPVAVLTAKHCITGDNFSGQNVFGGGGGKTGLVQPLTVFLGNPIGTPQAVYTSLGAPSVLGDTGAVNDQERGSDVAIVWLNRTSWASTGTTAPFTLARIVRPELRSPVPSDGDDSEGGDYNVPIGMSGWSPNSNHNAAYRQVTYYGSIYHYPGYPNGGPGTPSGQYWVHAQGAGNLEGGDSGGPLFWKRPDGARQVLGVAHGTVQIPFAIDGFDCTLNKCDVWTDVTRGNIARWVQDQMLEVRSPAWLQAHGKTVQWKGEVEYTGPCTPILDSDCDHWYDQHDTCPNDYNPDQIEGMACPLPAPPANPPRNCRPELECSSVVTLRCDEIGSGAAGVLERLQDDGNWRTVSTVPANGYPQLPASDYAGPVGSATYRVCARNAGGETCTGIFVVTPRQDRCSTPSPCTDNCGGRMCGGPLLPPCHRHLIQ